MPKSTTLTDATKSSQSGLGTPVRVALVNDYEIVLEGLRSMLAPFDDRIQIVDQAVRESPDVSADIALFDTFAGRRNALERAKEMAEEGVVDRIVLYTWDAIPGFVSIARDNGVSAVILKSTTGRDLVDQLLLVADGHEVGLDEIRVSRRTAAGESLSNREQEVLALLALGYSNPQIADELFLSVDTVKTYVRRVFAKLGVTNRTSAALLAARYDLSAPATKLSSGRAAG